MEKTLEDQLRERVADPRAMTAALAINSGRVLLTFGSVALLPRLVLEVSGDEVVHANKRAAEEASEAPESDAGSEERIAFSGAYLGQSEEERERSASLAADPVITLSPPVVVPTGGTVDNPAMRAGDAPQEGDPNPPAIVEQPGGEPLRVGDPASAGEDRDPVAPPPPVPPEPPVDPSDPSRPTDPHDPKPPVPAADVAETTQTGTALAVTANGGTFAAPTTAETSGSTPPAGETTSTAGTGTANEAGNGSAPPPTGGETPPKPRETVDPKDHNRAALVKMAEDAGLVADDNMTKAQIAALLNARP